MMMSGAQVLREERVVSVCMGQSQGAGRRSMGRTHSSFGSRPLLSSSLENSLFQHESAVWAPPACLPCRLPHQTTVTTTPYSPRHLPDVRPHKSITARDASSPPASNAPSLLPPPSPLPLRPPSAAPDRPDRKLLSLIDPFVTPPLTPLLTPAHDQERPWKQAQSPRRHTGWRRPHVVQ